MIVSVLSTQILGLFSNVLCLKKDSQEKKFKGQMTNWLKVEYV